MAYIASDPSNYEGQAVGTGQCVAFVQKAAGAPVTSSWKRGALVKGNTTLPKGTAIATFSAAGQYTNSLDGSSHGAIYIGQDAAGLQVWDQWKGQPVHQRTIRFQNGAVAAHAVNDGNAFYVIE